MDRLTAEDLLMLWPDGTWPQDIGAVAILDSGPLLDADGGLRLEAARAAIAARLPLVPRLRQVLYRPRRGLGRPLWVDAPAFDVADHVRLAAVPPPGDDAALLAVVAGLRRRRLDMSRPLWEMWFLPGLAGGRVGLFVRLHHVVADGIAGVATMATFLDAAPIGPPPSGPPWTPSPRPAARDLLLDNVRTRLTGLQRSAASLLHPVAGLRAARAAWPALRELVAEQRVPPTSLNRLVAGERRLAAVRGSMDEVTAVAHAHGATVNDVLLAITAAGLRALLHGRGETADVVRVYVPVTLRALPDRAGARGNLIGQMVVPLPLAEADPARRLRLIAAETARRKRHPHPSIGALFGNRLVGLAALKLIGRNPVNVETADVPGPAEPLYLAGARVLEVFPLLNLIGTVSLGVGALSYAGQFGVLAVADGDGVPDLDVFRAGAQQELRALVASCPATPAPPPAAPAGGRVAPAPRPGARPAAGAPASAP